MRDSIWLRSLSLAKDIDEGSLQCIIFAISWWGQMSTLTSPAVLLSRTATIRLNMVKSTAMAEVWVVNWASTWRSRTSGLVV